MDIVKQQGTLGPGGTPVVCFGVAINMILPAVVVVVEEGGPLAGERDREIGDVRLVADVGEVGVAVVSTVQVGKARPDRSNLI